jgi:metal-responsive CopG/Arc/MetJ family transcriptional regulator
MPRVENKIEMQRLNLAVPKSLVERIDRVMRMIDASSRTEVIRRAVEEFEANHKGEVREKTAADSPGPDHAGNGA